MRIKDLGRIDGIRENMIVGYGIVSGLASTGDSARSEATLQSVANALREFGVTVTAAQLRSRNVAAVLVMATLPAFSRSGDRVDVNVSSLGDARSLVGGTLLMTPLYGPDRKVYALAQGAVSIGGYKFDQFGNTLQKNHPTAGNITRGRAGRERGYGKDRERRRRHPGAAEPAGLHHGQPHRGRHQ
ncbi:MAG: flagellar basal body P-ring protein FlgI [Chromatiales bacterium]|nr:flagellar basal body P-ring protein FlgI [Chromatiales bacterium]